MSEELPHFSLTASNYSSGFSVANFDDAEETRPSGIYSESLGGGGEPIQGIVQATLGRHLRESLPTTSPPLVSAHTHNWRKHLREMMIKQNDNVLSFLAKPVSEHSILGPVEAMLRRYAIKQDVDVNSIKTLRDILSSASASASSGATGPSAPSVANIQAEISECILKRGSSNLQEIRSQVNSLIELYKETSERLMDAENQLKMRVEKMDKIQKRVSIVMELQTNDATSELISSLEKYLEVSFRSMEIEPLYKSVIYYYQKQMALRESIQLFKTTNVVNEPLCPICLTDSVSTAISPCGHTFCSTCSKKMPMECGVCRGRIRDRLKLYFS
jgi:hypothetical protein